MAPPTETCTVRPSCATNCCNSSRKFTKTLSLTFLQKRLRTELRDMQRKPLDNIRALPLEKWDQTVLTSLFFPSFLSISTHASTVSCAPWFAFEYRMFCYRRCPIRWFSPSFLPLTQVHLWHSHFVFVYKCTNNCVFFCPSNILEWHYVVEGSKGTVYEGGWWV